MALTSQIKPYDDRWPVMFEVEKALLQVVFAPHSVEIQHVGSTAVPGLAAKPEIDLLIVSDHQDEDRVDQDMASLGYERGKDLSNGHMFYRRDVGGIRTHKVHVFRPGHWQIFRMLRFRDMLRQDDELRLQYQVLKLELESKNESGIKEYLSQKAPFIDAVVGLLPKG
ncbi:GrpB family protein [Agrobacterium sp. rho-13.3]|uniref:GrpB family protein n=1 Tax=Agrobacterium sp. rho-13.3 TaxID=3072980 RepID=UPI002A101310|nr:GrpB family protein [Agrobacterium sp. rho-13.3]MDX8306216.1 GrpB family protein [Agrobacterium sp. rho-13.3]MDX8307453.1 GrpB family protein [Agrobacterium sp. rho-13.3]